MPRFKKLDPHLMDIEEMLVELSYQKKRLYRLEKLKRLGKDCEPDLSECKERENTLDLAWRERRRLMAEIPS